MHLFCGKINKNTILLPNSCIISNKHTFGDFIIKTLNEAILIYQWRSKVPKSGGAHRHVIYVPSVKNQYKRVVFGCMVI